jgi:serine/threonine protein kinase
MKGAFVDSEYQEIDEKWHVYRHLPTSRKVVFFSFDSHSNESFHHKVEVMSKINHPTLLSYFYVKFPSVSNSKALFVSDFMENGSLNDMNQLVYQRKPLEGWNPTAISKAVLNIAVGMNFIHELEFLHRDLCPVNILVDSNVEIKISGFSQTGPEDDPVIAKPTNLFFEAPERYGDGKQICSTRMGDVHLFRILLYSLFAQPTALDDKPYMPWQAGSLILRVSRGARVVLSRTIPIFYQDFITACWDAKRDRRPTFEEIIDSFKNDRN